MSGKFALIIGNTEYTDPGLAQLTAPGKDAEDFARILKDKDLCAFDEVKILLNQLSSSVVETVDEFFDQRKPDDMLVLYFSGHGVRDEMGLLYLAVKNTIRSRLRSTAIRSDYIREAMDQSRSKRQILILDCCNSGAFPQGTKAELGGPMGMTKVFQGYGRFVLTASDATQFAWEGEKVIGQTQNSLFTHFLVKGLEGEADIDGDGKITVDELYDYAFDQISRVTPKQTPTKSASKQEGEIVLRRITRIEDIKPVSLPDELLEAIEDSRTFVREGAVQQLDKLLKGKNLGLARSAREALERISEQDDSRRVALLAMQALESSQPSLRQATQEKASAVAQALNEQKADQGRINTPVARKITAEPTKTLKSFESESIGTEIPVSQPPIQPKHKHLQKWTGMGISISLLCALMLGLTLLNPNNLFKDGVTPPASTLTSTPSVKPELIPTTEPTNTPRMTASPATSPCFSLLTPENGAELEASQRIDFTWESFRGATRYRLEIILPNESILYFESEDTSIIRYTESIPTAGTYQWQITAYDVDEEILCTAGPFSFSKPQSNSPKPTKRNNDSSGEPATSTVTAFP